MGLLQLALDIITLFLILSTTIFTVYSFISNFYGAPYLPTSKEKRKIVLELASIKKGQKVVDLGSGDGLLIISLARNGALAHGIELNPILVLVSRFLILLCGCRSRAFIHNKNFWNVNLASYSLVIVYGLPSIMLRLEEKLKKQLRPGTRIISNEFKFPNLKLIKQRRGVYLYQI